MSKILLRVFLVCVCFVGCFSLQLRNLCERDHFTYNGILVNAVYLAERLQSLGPVSKYAIVSASNCQNELSPEENLKFFDKLLELKKK